MQRKEREIEKVKKNRERKRERDRYGYFMKQVKKLREELFVWRQRKKRQIDKKRWRKEKQIYVHCIMYSVHGGRI